MTSIAWLQVEQGFLSGNGNTKRIDWIQSTLSIPGPHQHVGLNVDPFGLCSSPPSVEARCRSEKDGECRGTLARLRWAHVCRFKPRHFAVVLGGSLLRHADVSILLRHAVLSMIMSVKNMQGETSFEKGQVNQLLFSVCYRLVNNSVTVRALLNYLQKDV